MARDQIVKITMRNGDLVIGRIANMKNGYWEVEDILGDIVRIYSRDIEQVGGVRNDSKNRGPRVSQNTVPTRDESRTVSDSNSGIRRMPTEEPTEADSSVPRLSMASGRVFYM